MQENTHQKRNSSFNHYKSFVLGEGGDGSHQETQTLMAIISSTAGVWIYNIKGICGESFQQHYPFSLLSYSSLAVLQEIIILIYS